MTSDRSIEASAPRSRVWRALTDMDEFAQWFRVKCRAGRLAPGERVDMVCTTPKYKGGAFYLVVDEMTPEQRFTWRWHPGVEKLVKDFSSEPMTKVGFELLPSQRREKAQKENDGGWEYMLGALVRHL